MKKLLTFLTLLLLSNIAFSQDNIILKNGNEINAKISEINESNIKYKKFNNLDGPIYTKQKDEIFMIKYSNGEKEVITNQNRNNNIKKKNVLIGASGSFKFESSFENDDFLSTSNVSVNLSIGGYLSENFVLGAVIGGSTSTINGKSSGPSNAIGGLFIRGYYNDFYSQVGYTLSEYINALTTGIGFRIYLNNNKSVSLNPELFYYSRNYTELDIKQSGIIGGLNFEFHL